MELSNNDAVKPWLDTRWGNKKPQARTGLLLLELLTHEAQKIPQISWAIPKALDCLLVWRSKSSPCGFFWACLDQEPPWASIHISKSKENTEKCQMSILGTCCHLKSHTWGNPWVCPFLSTRHCPAGDSHTVDRVCLFVLFCFVNLKF